MEVCFIYCVYCTLLYNAKKTRSPLSSTSSTKAILKFLVMVVVAACGWGGGCCGVGEHLFEAGRLFILSGYI